MVRWILAPDKQSCIAKKSRRFGCGPESCASTCDKAWSGVCLSGHAMRFSAVQLEGRASNGPLPLFVDGVFEILRKHAP